MSACVCGIFSAFRNLLGPGYSYDGDWVEDKKEGEGFLTWDLGSTYVGQFKADHKYGSGKCLPRKKREKK